MVPSLAHLYDLCRLGCDGGLLVADGADSFGYTALPPLPLHLQGEMVEEVRA